MAGTNAAIATEAAPPRSEKPSTEDKIAALADAVEKLVKRVDDLARPHGDEDDREADEDHDEELEEPKREKRRMTDDGRRRRVDSAARHDADQEAEALAVATQEWDQVAQFHGQRIGRPLDGETPLRFVRRCAKKFQHHSEKWKNENLGDLPPSVLLNVAAPTIRQDAIAAAYLPDPDAPAGLLREIKRRDRSGREISEFVGSVAATLDPFRLPSMRASFDPELVRRGKLGL